MELINDYEELKEQIHKQIKKTEKEIKKELQKKITEQEYQKFKNIIYTDLNIYEIYSKIHSQIQNETTNYKTSDFGIKIRVWDGKQYHETSFQELSINKIETELKKTHKIALKKLIHYINKKDKFYNEQFKNEPQKYYEIKNGITIFKNIDRLLETDFSKTIIELKRDKNENEEKTKRAIFGKLPQTIDEKEIFDIIKRYKNRLEKLDKKIITTSIKIVEKFERTIYISRDKIYEQRIPINYFICMIYVKKNETEKREIYKVLCDDELNKTIKKFEEKIPLIKKELKIIDKYKKIDGGRYDVIISPKISGLLAHESFGHGMEFDTIFRKRANVINWFGKQIAPPFINIIDFPLITETKNGSYYFDHEGNLSTKTYLVKNGQISTPLLDLFTRSILNYPKSCNSRYMSYDHKNYIRMSNTYFTTDKETTLDEMIKTINDGIYVFDTRGGGMEDPKGWGVQLQNCLGQRIKNGKLIDEYYENFTISGYLPEILGNIEKASNELKIEGVGMCGKGHKEWVRVSEGGPHLLIKKLILG